MSTENHDMQMPHNKVIILITVLNLPILGNSIRIGIIILTFISELLPYISPSLGKATCIVAEPRQ